MADPGCLSEEQVTALRAEVIRRGLQPVAAELGVSREGLASALAGVARRGTIALVRAGLSHRCASSSPPSAALPHPNKTRSAWLTVKSATPNDTRNNEEGKAETALRALVVALVPLVAAELRASGVSGDELVNDCTPGLPFSPRKIRTLAKEGAFPAQKRGRRWCFRRSDLEAYAAPAPAARVTSTPANETDPVADLGRSLGLRLGGAR